MNAQQLHQIDMTIAKAMGKPHPRLEFDGCWIKKRENEFVRFQPTYDPADAMDVLGWIVNRPNVDKIVLDGWEGFHIMYELYNGNHYNEVRSETLPLAISFFAEKIINTNPSK